MGPKKARNASNISDDTVDDQDSLALRLVELLNDNQVIAKLKTSLFPKELVLDAQTTDDAVVDAQTTDDAVVDAQPPPKRRRKEAETCVHNQAKYLL